MIDITFGPKPKCYWVILGREYPSDDTGSPMMSSLGNTLIPRAHLALEST